MTEVQEINVDDEIKSILKRIWPEKNEDDIQTVLCAVCDALNEHGFSACC